jgi:hypothetical protein
MSSFPKLPHGEAGTNLVEAAVENNAERVFDFIVAEDVVVHLRKTAPAIAAVEDQSGTWNHAGAPRIIVMDDGNRFRETIMRTSYPTCFTIC